MKHTFFCLVSLSKKSRVRADSWKYLENCVWSSSNKGSKDWRDFAEVYGVSLWHRMWVDPTHSPDQFDSQTVSMLSPKVSTQGMGQGFRWFSQPYLWAGRTSYNLGLRRLCVVGGFCPCGGFCFVFWGFFPLSFLLRSWNRLSLVVFHYS